jgi:hypothetical protein
MSGVFEHIRGRGFWVLLTRIYDTCSSWGGNALSQSWFGGLAKGRKRI